MAINLSINDYHPEYQSRIDDMMKDIQKEFSESISSPQSTKMYEVYMHGNQHYWVALYGDKVVGTAGLVLHNNHAAIVKRMMVHPDYRGSQTMLATRLLDTCIYWGKEKGVQTVYLGTMLQFVAAQRFYVKQGFKAINASQMPVDAVLNPIDALYYCKNLY